MPEHFIGELSKVGLLDLVRPLVNRKNSGMVLVRGTELGELYIEAGHIVHAKTGAALGDEAVLAMIDWNKGTVIFDWESATDERTVHLPTEQVLALWAEREKELKRIKEVVPSGDAVFRIPTNSTSQDRHIPSDQWRILTLLNGARSVAEVAGMLGRNVSEISKAICQMVEAGLLQRVEEATPRPRETVNKDFLPTIETELKKALGPIAQVVVDHKIAEFGESRSAFPRHRAQAFVRSVAEEISDEAKRDKFELGILEVSLREIESTHELKPPSESPGDRMLSAVGFWETMKPEGESKTSSAGRTEPNVISLPGDMFKPDAAKDTRPQTRRWVVSLGYAAVILLVVGLGLAFIFTGPQANRPVPVESGPPAAPKNEIEIPAAPVPSEAPVPPPAPAPIPEEPAVSPAAEPKPPAPASHQPKSVKPPLSGNRESRATRYIAKGEKQHRDGNYVKAKEAFLQALASNPGNRRATEGLRKVQAAMEAEEKLFKK